MIEVEYPITKSGTAKVDVLSREPYQAATWAHAGERFLMRIQTRQWWAEFEFVLDPTLKPMGMQRMVTKLKGKPLNQEELDAAVNAGITAMVNKIRGERKR